MYIVVQKSFFLPQRRRDAEGIISLRLCASAGDHSYYAPAEETYLDSYIWQYVFQHHGQDQKRWTDPTLSKPERQGG